MTRLPMVVAAISVVSALCLLTKFTGSDAWGASENDGTQPHLSLDAATFDFGKIDEGAVVTHTFKISNTGKSLLKLDEPTATCGCTIPRLARRKLKPDESTELSISIDTAMKQNAITKTVFVTSNDPEQPTVAIPLSMFVQNPHNGLTDADGAKIFTDQHCASCHVAKGVGKQGRDLYNADCAMCHGPKAEGAVGPALFRPYSNANVTAHIQEVIAAGSTTHRSMPGFLDSHGGPLTEKQVESIVDYLKGLSKARGIY